MTDTVLRVEEHEKFYFEKLEQGAHTWTVAVTDGVDWKSSGTVSTKYDITVRGIDETKNL